MSGKQRTTTAKPVKGAWRRHRLAIIFALFLWLVVTALGYLWCRVQVVQMGYLLPEAHRIHSRLLNDNKKLHLELARLKAPERLERIAIEQLGLNHPNKDQVVVLP